MTTEIEKYIEGFSAYIDVKPITKACYASGIKVWSEWLILNGISWNETRKPHVIKFRDDLYETKKRSTLYINTLLRILNRFYDYLQDAGLYPLNIAANVKKLEGYKGFRMLPLEPQQAIILLRSIDKSTNTGKRDALIIRLMLVSGLRCVEASRLNTSDIHLENKPYIMVMGKGKSNRVKLGISHGIANDLKEYVGKRIKKENEPVFLVWESAHASDRMTPSYIGIAIKKRMVDAGITDQKKSAHSLRHTCAVQHIRNGDSSYDVSRIMRHSSENMTANYLRYIEDERRINSDSYDQVDEMYQTKQIPIVFQNGLIENK